MNQMTTRAAGGDLIIEEQAGAIRTALKTSLYPGASDASVDLVLAYCKAAGLDPMKKPVHIVPMWDNKARTMRDVVMPGIGLYRTDAARTGEFAGMSKPVFGPMVTENVGGREVTFPEWCEVTVYRQLRSGHIAEYTATEYWIENYAIKGGKDQDQSPNAMWTKRARGQLAKCTEAQALRKAFPEAVGSQPTAEEMEGKAIIDGELVRDERRSSTAGAITRQQQAEPQDTPERQALYASLQEFAECGMEEYQGAWGRLSKEQRQLIGSAGHETLKGIAERASATVIEEGGQQSAADEEVPL